MSEPIQIKSDDDTLRAENRTLRSELRAANERIADLAGQIKQRGESRVIAPYEEEAIREQARAFAACNDEQNKLGKYLRENFARQISRGEHNGLGLADICIRYMKPWWKRILG